MFHLAADLDPLPRSPETSSPSDEEIRRVIRDIASDSSIEIEELSLRQCLRIVSQRLECNFDDLYSKKKDFVKTAIEQEIQKHAVAHEEDLLPTEEEIHQAAKNLTKKVNKETTSFKKFIKLLADELDVEDLTPAKPIIKKVYDMWDADANVRPDLPSDATIVAAAKKLAYSNRVDLEEITRVKFLRLLQKRMGGIDLSAKKKLVADTLKECKQNHSDNNKSLRTAELKAKSPKEIDDSFSSSGMTNAESMQNSAGGIAMMPIFFNSANHPPTKAVEIPSKPNPRSSQDLEQGRKIPQASGLVWTDSFFDDDIDGLVAVFDHDYSAMIKYEMRVIILRKIVPIIFSLVALIVLAGVSKESYEDSLENCESDIIWSDYNTYDVYDDCSSFDSTIRAIRIFQFAMILWTFFWFALTIFGHYRIIRSTVRALHVAILQDGIQAVHDDHITSRIGILGAFPCLDTCLLVSKQSETIPFDQLTKLTVKSPGEVNRDLCCWCCCVCCLRIPYFTVALDTGSSNPYYYEACMSGLIEPQKFEKLAWAMKRDNYEHVHKETHQILLDNHREAQQCQMNMQQMMMMDTMMKYGMSPGMMQQQQQQSQLPSVISTAPTSASTSTSTASSVMSPMSMGFMPNPSNFNFSFPAAPKTQ